MTQIAWKRLEPGYSTRPCPTHGDVKRERQWWTGGPDYVCPQCELEMRFWRAEWTRDRDDLMEIVKTIQVDSDKRRRGADYDTGSITEYEAFLLLALAKHLNARTVIEVGTFIGMSTEALASAPTVEAVFTCDASNDCLPTFGAIRTYPKQTSTEMLTDLVKRKVRADLCFFDGVLSAEDVDLLLRLTHPETVYAFHDYNYGPKIRKGGKMQPNLPRKGIGNVRLLQPRLSGYTLIDPKPDTTLALLVPESRL